MFESQTAEPQKDAMTEQQRQIQFGSLQHLHYLIDSAGSRGVSDFHVVPNQGTWYLTDGDLQRETDQGSVFSEEHILGWLTSAEARVGNNDTFVALGHASVSYDTGNYRVRASFRKTTIGITVTFRLIPFNIPSVEDLELPESVVSLMHRSSGLILIEGPTGSGKTTAIAALLERVNEERNEHIYTIEDPVEFVHKPRGNTLFTQREIGEHAADFPSAIENALRSKPNIVLVGEMLNPATAKSALHAATTGHLVLTTAHAGSVNEALDAFIGQFVAEEQPQIRTRLSQSLLAVMVQRLVPSTGRKLVPARELLINNLNFREMIAHQDTHLVHQSLESTAGCFSLEQDLAKLVRAGQITEATALDMCKKRDSLENHLRSGSR